MKYYYMLETEQTIGKFKKFILKLLKLKVNCEFDKN